MITGGSRGPDESLDMISMQIGNYQQEAMKNFFAELNQTQAKPASPRDSNQVKIKTIELRDLVDGEDLFKNKNDQT